MPRLAGLEDKGINIQTLAVPETKTQFAWKPENYITPTKWSELLTYVEGKASKNDFHAQTEAVICASAMVTLFPERRDQVAIPKALCVNGINEYVARAEHSSPEEQKELGLSLVRYLSRVRPLFPELVAAAGSQHRVLVDKGGDYIVEKESQAQKGESWEDAVDYVIATGRHINGSKLRWRISELLDECREKMKEPGWWNDGRTLMYLERLILPAWVYSPDAIDPIRPAEQDWIGISEMLLNRGQSQFPYVLLDDVLRMTLLRAEDVRLQQDRIHFTLPDSHEETKYASEAPPQRRSF